jgi:hypothetical protein
MKCFNIDVNTYREITVNVLKLNLPSFCLLNKLELSVLTDALVTNTERLYSLPRKCISEAVH